MRREESRKEIIETLATNDNYKKNLNELVKLFNMTVDLDNEHYFVAYNSNTGYGDIYLKKCILDFAIQNLKKHKKITHGQIEQLTKILNVLEYYTKQKDYYYFVISLHNKLKEEGVY